MVRLTVLPAAGIVTLDTVTPGATADTVFISVAADGAAVLLTTTPSNNCYTHSHTTRLNHTTYVTFILSCY